MTASGKAFLIRILLLGSVAPILIILASISSWLICFGILSGFMTLSIVAAGVALGVMRKSFLFPLLVPVGWILAMCLLFGNSLGTYEKRRIQYSQRLSGNGELGWIEKANIYGLHLVMAMSAFPIYPEASFEALGLMVPSVTGMRYFESGFFLESDRIRKSLAMDSHDSRRVVKWSVSEYSFGNPESRFALALNPCELNWKSGDTSVEAKVRIEYPAKSEVKLGIGPMNITVEEGLFAYLQKAGWLHPYTAVWKGSFSSCSRP